MYEVKVSFSDEQARLVRKVIREQCDTYRHMVVAAIEGGTTEGQERAVSYVQELRELEKALQAVRDAVNEAR